MFNSFSTILEIRLNLQPLKVLHFVSLREPLNVAWTTLQKGFSLSERFSRKSPFYPKNPYFQRLYCLQEQQVLTRMTNYGRVSANFGMLTIRHHARNLAAPQLQGHIDPS